MHRFAVFSVGPRAVAVPVKRVLGFTKDLQWTRLPFAPRGVIGVCNWRGDVCPLVDVGTLMEIEGAGGPWACAVDTEQGPLVILADAVLGLEEGEVARVEEALFEGVYNTERGERFVLSVDEVAILCSS